MTDNTAVVESTPDQGGIEDTLFSVTASDIIRYNLADYIVAIISALFPSPIDGQKKIIRRFLYAASDKSDRSIGRGQHKSDMVVAEVNKYHPFSPKSMYDALVRLSQPWCVNHGFVDMDGNNGSYYDGEPAASRYTEMSITDFLKAVFFRDIDLSVLPMTLGASGDLEPKHFIPSIPMALVNDNLTIGYGYQSKTACLHLDSVCDLVGLFVEHEETTPWLPFPVDKCPDIFIPDFPTPCILTNYDELIAAYKRRDFSAKIKMDGHLAFVPNYIIVRSLPHSQSFSPLLSVVQEAIDNKSKGGKFIPELEKKIQSVNILEPRNAPKGLYVEMKRGVNHFDLWRDLQKIIHLSGTFVPNPNYFLPSQTIASLDYINIMKFWYDARRSAVLSTKRRQLQSIKERQWVIEAEIIVIDHTERVIFIARNFDNEERIKKLSEEFGLTPYQSEALLSTRLSSLGKSSALELQQRLDATREAIAKMSASFNTVGAEISALAQKIKKDFSKPRHMSIPKYIGCVYVDGGFVQFEDYTDVPLIAECFPKGRFDVEVYSGAYRVHLDEVGRVVKDDLHQYSFGSILSFKQDYTKAGYYTVSIKDGAACYVEGAWIAPPSENFTYVRKTAMGVTRKGEVSRFNVREKFSMRKTPGRGANTDIIQVFPDQTKTYYIAILNDADKNVIHLQKVDPNDTKVVISPVGNPVVLVSSTGKDWFINFPENYTHRIGARCFQIKDAETLFDGDTKQIRLDVATPKVKRNPNIISI